MNAVEIAESFHSSAAGSSPSALDDLKACLHQLDSENERLAISTIRNRAVRNLPLMKRSALFDLVCTLIGLVRRRHPENVTRLIAYHEAGHAVMAFHADVGIRRIIFPHKGFFLAAQVSRLRSYWTHEERILSLLAGAAAADLVASECGVHPLWGACVDFHYARSSELFDSVDATHANTLLLRHFMPLARRIVAAEAPAVHALAAKLRHRRWMRGDEVEEILRRHWTGTAPPMKLDADAKAILADERSRAWKAFQLNRLANFLHIVHGFQDLSDDNWLS